ncbi:MAG: hypothetical protein GDA38_07895 [Hormoscilla sp. SP12CHS1]|nr:hypothetical protein [Hormoscilla sp. SP12CHS1]
MGLNIAAPNQREGVNISVEMRDKLREWQFGIHDNGIGIESEHFESIFEIFQPLPRNIQALGLV